MERIGTVRWRRGVANKVELQDTTDFYGVAVNDEGGTIESTDPSRVSNGLSPIIRIYTITLIIEGAAPKSISF